MNTFKKIMASVLAISSVSMLSAGLGIVSADSSVDFTASYDVVNSAFVTDNGVDIPVGAVAITISADNAVVDNTLLNVSLPAEAEFIKGENGIAAYNASTAFDSAMFSAVKNADDNGATIAIASEATESDGAIVTFYVTGNIDTANAPIVTERDQYSIPVAASRAVGYIGGDANGNLLIELDDATLMNDVMGANGGSITMTFLRLYGSAAFPDIMHINAVDVNATPDGVLNSLDSQLVLEYYAHHGAGYETTEIECGLVGKYLVAND